MADNKYMPNESPDLIDEMLRRTNVLSKRVNDLERMLYNQDTPPPLPRIDPATYPSPYEGQRAVDVNDEQHTWYSNEAWRKANDIPWARISFPYTASQQSIADNSITLITMANSYNMAEGESGYGYFVKSGNWIEILVDGSYLVLCHSEWATNDVGIYSQVLSKGWGGHYLFPGETLVDTDSARADLLHWSTIALRLHESYGESIALSMWQHSGSAKYLEAAYLEITRVGNTSGVNKSQMSPNN